MKEVLLHIGTHKTGSTTIQRALAGFSDGVTRSADFGYENHSIPIYTIFSARRASYHIWQNQGRSPAEVEALRASFLETLHAELEDASHDRLIISGEDISALTRAEMFELIDLIRAKGLGLKVVVFTRSPLSYVASDCQERIKSGLPPVPTALNYRRKIEPFVTRLGAENVILRDFDSLVQGGQDLVTAFSDLAGAALPAVANANESISLLAMSLTHWLNRAPLQVLGRPLRYGARNRIVTRITQLFGAAHGYEKPPRDIFRPLVEASTAQDCAWLHENFAVTYDSTQAEGGVPALEAAMKACLDASEAEIEQLFEVLDVRSKPGQRLEGRFLEALVCEIEHARPNRAFDADRYLALNPDVAASGMNPYEHFLRYGQAEGRKF